VAIIHVISVYNKPREIIHMKKVIAVLFVACVLASSLFATFSFKSVGVETAFGRHAGLYLSANMEAAKDLDVYTRFGYTEQFNASLGLQYKVAGIKLSNMTVPFKPGLQFDFNFGSGLFNFEALVTLGFSFETKAFSAILRPAFGMNTSKAATVFVWGMETGVAFAL
jgi:hypothetical protein